MSDRFESVLFTAEDASVFGIPPLKTTKGRKASDWDVSQPLWQGRLKVLEIEDDNQKLSCEVRLEDIATGELFASAPYSSSGAGIDPVLDSSRYFAITLIDGPRHAIMGLGFPDRSIAFEFNIALQDFQKHAQPVSRASHHVRDYALKEGQHIHVDVGKHRVDLVDDIHSEDPVSIPTLLPPPPSAGKSRAHLPVEEPAESPFDDDFGDFQG